MQEAYYVVMREAMGAEPIAGTKLRLLWFLKFSAKELALARKEEVFKKGWKLSFSWSSNRTVTDGKEFPVFAKGRDGQEGDVGQAHKVQVWSWIEFLLLQQGRVVIHASEEKAEGERKQQRGTAEAVCGVGVSSRSCPCWNNTKSFLDHGRVFPALTSTSENSLLFPATGEEGSPF